jgi:hypothetical protein
MAGPGFKQSVKFKRRTPYLQFEICINPFGVTVQNFLATLLIVILRLDRSIQNASPGVNNRPFSSRLSGFWMVRSSRTMTTIMKLFQEIGIFDAFPDGRVVDLTGVGR